MAIKKYRPLSPDPYVNKIKGDTEFARLAHLNDLVDQVNNIPAPEGLPYTSYVAKITQSGTSDPVVTVLYNNTGLTINWTRKDVGVYSSNFLTGSTAKIVIGCTPGAGPTGHTISSQVLSAGPGSIYFIVSSLACYPGAFIVSTGPNDGLLTNATLEIKIYP